MWIQNDDNRDEVLALYYTAKEFGQRPSYYAFGNDLLLQSQYEIDLAVICVGKAYEEELLERARGNA